MKRYIRIISLWACLFFMCACYEDKGHYDIVDYNEITSLNINNTLSKTSVVLGDTVYIFPELKWKYTDRDTTQNAFEYRWEYEGSVVSTERNLKFVPGKFGTTTVYLFVTEKETGVVSRLITSIVTSSAYKTGYLILSAKNEKTSLTFIRRDQYTEDGKTKYEYVVYEDLYAKAFPGDELGTGPLDVSILPTEWAAADVVLTQQNGGCWYLNGNDFSKRFEISANFIGGEYPEEGFEPVATRYAGFCDFVLGRNGDVYSKQKQNAYMTPYNYLFASAPLCTGISQVFDVKVCEMTSNTDFGYMYDGKNHRFLACMAGTSMYANSLTGRIFPITNNFDPATFVDINDMRGYKLIYCGQFNGPNFMNILKNEATGEYLYQTYGLQNMFSSLTLIDAKQEVFAGSQYITDNTIFLRSRTLPYLYFGEGTKLYFYDSSTKKTKLYADFSLDPDFKGGQISSIGQSPGCEEIGVGFDNGDLYICDAKTTAILAADDPSKEGILEKVSNLGRIVQVGWKWGGYVAYWFDRDM